MVEQRQLEQRQQDSLERLQASHALAVSRQREREASRQTYQREAAIIQGENAEELMKLKHELDRENRLLDHAFARAEDAREVERLATEITIRRRDDFIRHQWDMDTGLFGLEAKIVEIVASAVLSGRQSKTDHGYLMEARATDQNHEQIMEVERRQTLTHENELDKDNFEFKERLKQKLARESEHLKTEEIADILAQLNAGKPKGSV